MIALIIFGPVALTFLIISIIFGHNYIKDSHYDSDSFGFALTFTISLALITLILLILNYGQSIYKKNYKNYLIEKQEIEYFLEKDITYDLLEQARLHNRKVQEGNTYFCRFTIEDRSEFLINIEEYLEKKNE